MQQKVEDKGSPCRYKLTYFNLRGRGELPRLIFAAAGVPFEDKRIQFGKEWEDFKPKTPRGYLPILEFDGKTLDQSQTISRFLSKEFGKLLICKHFL
ncbi:hypothetical protein FSP39_011497 [Pinctada imbricata]|uniref:GST N-terminal domain-containing protein n=1 Tax=Pinctada imbricata TaxID=66713 RepID=A0AA88YQU2_PINIB|nr:hypothetical protein FSP39_011497 [Pinctada imbricata]